MNAMSWKQKRIVSLILVVVLCVCSFAGCGGSENSNSGTVYIPEQIIEEQFVAEQTINETYLIESYIMENMIYEDGIYEYVINENIISEAYIIEITIGENTEEELLALLPEEFDEYQIDWGKVIGKFAVGTTIIIATGVVRHYVKSTYFIFASPAEVARDAVIGGAIEATLRVALEADENGEIAEAAVKKYSIESFADGYMWGAITSVFSVMHKDFKLPKVLKWANGSKFKIATDGTVLDEVGNVLGKAYVGKKGIYVLKEMAGQTAVELFDLSGKQIVKATVEQAALITAKTLPANTVLRLGTDASAKICRTDAAGVIYRINNELVPNITYKLGTAVYQTDEYGRIIKVTFDKLTLNKVERASNIISNTASEIGRGFERAGDDRGHLIAYRFNGDNSIANIISMDSKLNRSEYKAMENLWAESIQSGKNVSGSIELTYSGDSFRPDTIEVLYDIGKGMVEKIFQN